MRTAIVLLSIVAVTVAASAAEQEVKLTDVKKIMPMDKVPARTAGGGMALSPDMTRLLYLRAKGSAAQLVLRDIAIGKDTEIPIPAYDEKDFSNAFVSMRVFSPDGGRLLVAAGMDEKHTGLMTFMKDDMYVGLYDIASGKIQKFDLTAKVVFPTLDGTGKNIVVMTMGKKEDDIAVYSSPTGKIKFRKLSVVGLPRSPCPGTALVPFLPPPAKGASTRPANEGTVPLWDIQADKEVASVRVEDSLSMASCNTQWTLDGRYLYLIDSVNGQRCTRVWDRKDKTTVSMIDGALPIGSGPTPTSVVLMGKDGPILHNAADKSTARIGDASMRVMIARDGVILYSMKVEGEESLYMAKLTTTPTPKAKPGKG